ncbi:hypothetical protein LSAT2_021981 [Lamellibrachia satsuma]|nr:hypothetical protein LSAT2_021981 [Lamellibrachia satsuma]
MLREYPLGRSDTLRPVGRSDTLRPVLRHASLRQPETPYKMNTSTKRILLFITIAACCVHESHSWFEECDGQSYDSRMETCCENILWAGATPYDECCGMLVYDNRKYVCCEGELFSKREREQC